MNNRSNQIGFSSQRIRLEWLEYVVNLILSGNSNKNIAEEVDLLLSTVLSGGGKSQRGSREKAASMIMKIWVTTPKYLIFLKESALKLYKEVPREYRICLHWGMAMAAYPFWGAVALCAGRLLRLQGETTAAQIRRRLSEIYGDREVISRATRAVVRCFVEWGVLNETKPIGTYKHGLLLNIDDHRLIAWMIEALLHSRTNGSAPIKELIDSQSLFPFRLKQISSESLLSYSSRLDVLRHGLNDDLIILRGESKKGTL